MSFTDNPASPAESEILASTDHRPWPLPSRKWAIRMRWCNLLFAHWPIPPARMAQLLPAGLQIDTFEGAAWVGVVPFRMERVQLRGLRLVPGAHSFAESNLRTYVRDPASGHRGVYFFSLDASSPLAVIAARLSFGLPYYFARMTIRRADTRLASFLQYRSERLFSRKSAALLAQYRGLGPDRALPKSQPGTVEHFLTERYALFTSGPGGVARADVHHLPWTLEPAEAEFQTLTVAAAHSIELPATKPLLHFSKRLDVFAWAPRSVRKDFRY